MEDKKKDGGEGLNQCPCDLACMCKMDELCLGCETYGEWLLSRTPDLKEEIRKLKAALGHADAAADDFGRVSKLVGFIEKYGLNHEMGCDMLWQCTDGLKCTCGRDEALAEAKGVGK